MADDMFSTPPIDGGVPPDSGTGDAKRGGNGSLSGTTPGDQKMIDRDPPDPPIQREELVKKWTGRIQDDKKHWGVRFDKMKDDTNFLIGKQWSTDDKDDRYVANIAQRHVASKVSALYAKNPRMVSQTRKKLDFAVWDEKPATLQAAMQLVGGAGMAGMGMPPGSMPGGPPPVAGGGPSGVPPSPHPAMGHNGGPPLPPSGISPHAMPPPGPPPPPPGGAPPVPQMPPSAQPLPPPHPMPPSMGPPHQMNGGAPPMPVQPLPGGAPGGPPPQVAAGAQAAVSNPNTVSAAAIMSGSAPGVMDPMAIMQAMALLQDVATGFAARQVRERMGQTLELLFEYELDQQEPAFKTSMKSMVRRAIVTGAGYIKLCYFRDMEPRPELAAQVNDMAQRIADMEQLNADIADGEIDEDSAEVEELRLALSALHEEMQTNEIVAREGLFYDYPRTWSIIPDRKTQSLQGFVGSRWVTQEYQLTPEQVEAIYKVDIKSSGFTPYKMRGRQANGEFGTGRRGRCLARNAQGRRSRLYLGNLLPRRWLGLCDVRRLQGFLERPGRARHQAEAVLSVVHAHLQRDRARKPGLSAIRYRAADADAEGIQSCAAIAA